MDTSLVNAAVGIKQAETLSRIQVAVAKKIMDVDKMNGSAALQLINAATQTSVQAGDRLAAAATGLGSQVDTYA
jgi:hypothetical protein